ncbi:hypothetical protein Mycch_6021 (plasmid) [Mycolicibacterium chubuense NBB4]|uniref:Uncharacterized protein n=1 Tax=Mycolicibacterium chubuense (strain NBB4) TaxID=710421 RepID=I4BTL4_MYCCN|nr:hypothetical protein Mycch_6021 [Mycolicibacterium chubuense NBB4]
MTTRTPELRASLAGLLVVAVLIHGATGLIDSENDCALVVGQHQDK